MNTTTVNIGWMTILMIKCSSLNFTSLSIDGEIDAYMKIKGIGVESVKRHLRKFKDKVDSCKKFPVCILSHMFDERRSKFLTQLVAESKMKKLDREYYIFVYEDQKHLYKEFEKIDNINVIYISIDEKEYSTLSGKRQYILEWNQKNKNEHAFFIEDDCFDFVLPIGSIGVSGSFRNKRFNMSFGMTFGFWESLIKENKLKYSGPVNNMEFAFRDLSKKPFIKHLGQTVQAVHIDIKFCKDKNIKFDSESGWDDYDMILQQCVYGAGTDALIFSYNTPSLKSGISAMSSDLNALSARCENNTTALIKKWGLSLVREDTKKGLYNAKVNWGNLRTAEKNKISPEKIIGMTHSEAKEFLKNNSVISNDLFGEW